MSSTGWVRSCGIPADSPLVFSGFIGAIGMEIREERPSSASEVRRRWDHGNWLDRRDLGYSLWMCACVLPAVRARRNRGAGGVIERRHGTKPLVLVVEDDPWLRSISSEVIRTLGLRADKNFGSSDVLRKILGGGF